MVASKDPGVARTVIGDRRLYQVREGDTFIDLARFYGLGYNEIIGANPGIDPWVPEVGHSIQLPTEWILPRAEWQGVVVNIPEMRLYYFPSARSGEARRVKTFPVGLGQEEFRTPEVKFRIAGKTKNPTWIIPESIRQERILSDNNPEKMIAGGDPRNPLGKYRFELSIPGYRIHGTNKSYGVGMLVSHGCVRLYPEDIETLFSQVAIGIPGEFVYQVVKVGARDGRVYIEVHPDIYTVTPGLFSEARRAIAASGWADQVDMELVEAAVEAQTGLPVDVTKAQAQEQERALQPGDVPRVL